MTKLLVSLGKKIIVFWRQYRWVILMTVGIFVVVAVVEFQAGRLVFGPDGRMGLWEGDIWSSAQSQRFADPYSFSHFIHGLLFYGLLWLVARKMPIKYRFVIALLLEAIWEVLENSPLVINRYREVTISLGYMGDSIFNSLSDIVFVGLGFLFALKNKLWLIVGLIIAMELGTLFFVRDNLTLNIIMLVSPIEAIKTWQSVGHIAPHTPLP